MFGSSMRLMAAGVLGLGFGVGAASGQVLPDFGAATFDSSSADITNPYMPFAVGSVWEYAGESVDLETGEVEEETILVEVLHGTRLVAGIESRIVRDRVFVEGLLVEDTFDWFAQDTAGNVWYMGEEVTDFHYDDEGNLTGVSHPGEWEAGVDGALPGYTMPVTPHVVGFSYYQEFLVGEAEDYGEIIGIDETYEVPGVGVFHSVLRTGDFSLDPDSFEHKLYTPGVGLIAEFGFETESGEMDSVVHLTSHTVVPEPSSALLAVSGIGMAVMGRRSRRGA